VVKNIPTKTAEVKNSIYLKAIAYLENNSKKISTLCSKKTNFAISNKKKLE